MAPKLKWGIIGMNLFLAIPLASFPNYNRDIGHPASEALLLSASLSSYISYSVLTLRYP